MQLSFFYLIGDS